jgi:ankyrin repeat protein
VHQAIKNNVDPKLLQLLLDFKADVNRRDAVGRFPLMFAIVLKGDIEFARPGEALVDLMLRAGAVIDKNHFSITYQPSEDDVRLMYAIWKTRLLIMLTSVPTLKRKRRMRSEFACFPVECLRMLSYFL